MTAKKGHEDLEDRMAKYRFLPLHHLPWMLSKKANCRIFFLENIPSTHQGVLIRYGLGLVDRVLDFLRIVALQFSKLWGWVKDT